MNNMDFQEPDEQKTQADLLQISARLDKFRSLSDKTLKLIFETQEVDSELGGKMLELQKSGQGWLLFKPSTEEIHPDEVPEVEAPDVGGKSPSKRLRDRMFVFYKKKNNGNATGFDSWYKNYLDNLGEKFLDKASDYEE